MARIADQGNIGRLDRKSLVVHMTIVLTNYFSSKRTPAVKDKHIQVSPCEDCGIALPMLSHLP